MDVDVRDHGGSRYTVHISLSEDEVQGAFDRTYQELSDRGGIRGFRPGKVPRKILDRNYDYDVIRAATYQELIEKRLEEAFEQENLRPIDQLDIEVGAPPDEDEELAETIKSGLAGEDAEEDADAESHEAGETEEPPAEEQIDEEAEEEPEEDEEIPLVEGEPFDFYTSFTSYPRPELPDFGQLELRRPVGEVTEEAVDERLEELRRLNAEDVDVDRETIEEGDRVVAEVTVLLEGEDPDEEEGSEQEIIVGDREYIGDIDQALIGHEPGDVVEVEYEYPEDHMDPNLAGQSARVIAEISAFSGRKLPELDDDFAQEVGEYENMEELRGSIRKQLQAEIDKEDREELNGQVLRYVLEESEMGLPEEFIEEAAERSYEELRQELQQMGMSIDEFADATENDEEQLRESQRARAESTLKLHFALEALAEEREIEVQEEDVARELQRIAEESGGDMQMIQQALAVQPNFAEEVQDRAMRRKLVDDIVASAEVEEVPREEYYAEKEQEAEQVSEEAQPEESAPADAPEAAQAEEVAADADEQTEADPPGDSEELTADDSVQESESE